MSFILFLLAALLIAGGLIGAIVPILPGIPMLFGGIWLAAAADDYRHLGHGWLIMLGVLASIGIACDFFAGHLGVKRLGASKQALWGTTIGATIGLFFGLAGLLLGPFIGALLGELGAGRGILRSTQVGIGTWVGMLIASALKLSIAVTMLALFAAAWWLGNF